MISVIGSWICIFICSFLLGTAFISLAYKKCNNISESYELCIITGLCICTVYAQFFSLINGIGLIAFVGLLIIAGLALGYLIFIKYDFNEGLVLLKQKSFEKKMLFGVAFIAVLLWTSISPQHYDTYLYHAQAIHWIEDYGVVPGLGNLHFRLAYDSAFMCLQALFGFRWMLGQSLHTINGFFTLLIFAKIIFSFSNNAEQYKISDVLSLGVLAYMLYDCAKISSPNTDTMALLLAFYIILKWLELAEDNIKDIEPYALLCVIVVFDITLKVSVGILILLVIFPAIYLVKNKKWLLIAAYIVQGAVILIPYLIRNIIVSGYIIYPYAFTGIKKFDWIMNEEILNVDRSEIIAWGRGNMDISRNAEHIWEWIGEWYGSINILWKVLFVVTLLAICYIGYFVIKNRKNRTYASFFFATVVSIACFIFWLFMAPLPRYGAIYMIMIPCIAIGLWEINKDKSTKLLIIVMKVLKKGILGAIVVYMLIFGGYIAYFKVDCTHILVQGDYLDWECRTDCSLGIDFFIPLEGDRTGYYSFPSTPYQGSIDNIVLRGDGLKDGFKYK